VTFFDCTADLIGQLNGNGQKGMLQIDAPRRKFLATPLATKMFSHSALSQLLEPRNII